ncbi:hypothetical protein [Balneatrix alpica]|uniref:Secreted protein n=1 Tax=Balneatrix alpica TaxID=75684 RepID=A0ABV5ZEX2_9GAMM|nr:hypothetical protein [Balneatrix alpica]
MTAKHGWFPILFLLVRGKSCAIAIQFLPFGKASLEIVLPDGQGSKLKKSAESPASAKKSLKLKRKNLEIKTAAKAAVVIAGGVRPYSARFPSKSVG